jgi:hypothetical protein
MSLPCGSRGANSRQLVAEYQIAVRGNSATESVNTAFDLSQGCAAAPSQTELITNFWRRSTRGISVPNPDQENQNR